jgi:hypothetical protein
MLRVRHRFLAVLVGGTVLTLGVGCGHSSASRARAICGKALPHVASASETTVGEIRNWKIGPGGQPGRGAFVSLKDDHAAAWCSVARGGGYDIFGVAEGQAVSFAHTEGSGVPNGPPMLP